MDILNVDLNLLVVFDRLMEQRSVTKAAESMALSQPATSAALSRLRSLLGDPLFVKTGASMQPTPRALALAAPVRNMIETVQQHVLRAPAFEPSSADKTFNLLAPDIAEVILLPRLLAQLRAQAPQVRLRVTSMPRTAAAQALESGAADLALGYFPDLQKSGFFQQRLFKHAYVCIVRSDHPRIGSRMSTQQFLAAPHAVVWPEGREHVFERFLLSRKLERRVVLELSHFMALQSVIASSDLIATVPSDLADYFVQHGNIRVVETPIRSPQVEVHQFWHQRLHKDVANVWLRALVHSTFKR